MRQHFSISDIVRAISCVIYYKDITLWDGTCCRRLEVANFHDCRVTYSVAEHAEASNCTFKLSGQGEWLRQAQPPKMSRCHRRYHSAIISSGPIAKSHIYPDKYFSSPQSSISSLKTVVSSKKEYLVTSLCNS